MAIVKFLKLDTATGIKRDSETTDELSLAKISVTGVSGIGADLGNQRLTNLAAATANSDAVTLLQLNNAVQLAAAGLTVKNAARAVATSNIALSGLQTVDGVSLVAGDRVLAVGQTTASENGWYDVAAGAWARSSDADTSAKLVPNSFGFISEGTVGADFQYVLTTNAPITLGTTALSFTQFGATAASPTAAQGINFTSNAISVSLNTSAAAQTAGVGGGSSGLEFDVTGATGKLQAAVNPTAGLERTATGLGIKLEPTPFPTLSSLATGLKVVGLPSLFEINGVATTAAVTAANVNTLVSGNDASALHSHNSAVGSYTAGAAVSLGQLVRSNGTALEVVPGSHLTVANANVFGMATAAAASAAAVKVASSGLVGELTGLTTGASYYLGTSGLPVLYSALTGAGLIVLVKIGVAVSATQILLDIDDPIQVTL